LAAANGAASAQARGKKSCNVEGGLPTRRRIYNPVFSHRLFPRTRLGSLHASPFRKRTFQAGTACLSRPQCHMSWSSRRSTLSGSTSPMGKTLAPAPVIDADGPQRSRVGAFAKVKLSSCNFVLSLTVVFEKLVHPS
jgi:hypothetical protein